uniref:ATP synthase subunit b, chloroplastic n=1 Tax=Caloglossa intermedia TaxID=100879 RepID=A0A1Z1M6Q7_9FLOR|nr:ATP synthase CF0 subunit I [Caloglossa intermedia]ARW61445.1 ATP synthase CF0 subunit I [Caloglossa intermedia]
MQVFYLLNQEYLGLNIGLNSNFLEANLINILLLLSGLIYVLKQFLGSILSTRQEKVLLAISESEERLNQAKIRLSEAEKQLTHAQIMIDQILNEAEMTAKKVRKSILEQGRSDIERLNASSKANIKYAENQVKQQIQQQIISLAVDKVRAQLQNQMTTTMQAEIIDKNIMELQGSIHV